MQQVFPKCCIHFEDWKGTDAIRVLARYTDMVLCYNDDIQGTASVTLAGLTTALQIVDAPLTEQRILFLGAGSAGIGIANLIASAMQMQGLSQDAARSRISLFDINGLIEPVFEAGVSRFGSEVPRAAADTSFANSTLLGSSLPGKENLKSSVCDSAHSSLHS